MRCSPAISPPLDEAGTVEYVLLTSAVAHGVAGGSVDLAFRRWASMRVRVGSSFIAAGHVIEVTSLEAIDPAGITTTEARRAGYDTPEDVRTALCVNVHNPTYRIGLRCIGEDPRIALRADDDLNDDDVAAIRSRLDRMDARSKHGPWTRAVLAVIARRPTRQGQSGFQDRCHQTEVPRTDRESRGRLRGVAARRRVPAARRSAGTARTSTHT